MNKILISCILLSLAAGFAYRWSLDIEYESIVDELEKMGEPLRTDNAIKVKKIRQLLDVLDAYKAGFPLDAQDWELAEFCGRVTSYSDVISTKSLLRAVSIILNDNCAQNHKYAFIIYQTVLNNIKNGNNRIIQYSEASHIYKKAIWIGRNHGKGLSKGVEVGDVVQLFIDGQEYCWSNYREEVSWFTYESAKFLYTYEGHDRSMTALENGLQYIGYNNNFDGSVIHEYGVALMRKSHRDHDIDILLKAVLQFDKAIELKAKSRDVVTRLYSRKLRLKALSDYYLAMGSKRNLLELKADYEGLINDWKLTFNELDDDGKRLLSQVYMGIAICFLVNGDEITARSYLESGKSVAEKYGPVDKYTDDQFEKLLNSIDK